MANILIVDDQIEYCNALSAYLSNEGHDTVSATTLKSGIDIAGSRPFDVVFLDVVFPEGSGLDVLPALKATPASPEVIILTGNAEPEGAMLAMQNGAWDYFRKGGRLIEVSLALKRALAYRETKLAAKSNSPFLRENIIGSSPALARSLKLASEAAVHDVTVLITGETGSGKELFARAIHQNSQREKGTFVVVDCAALPGNLVESMLFGHKKGAYTGADVHAEGLVAQADGGTLLLDEIGELSLITQAAFLRVLQEKRFRPVGSSHEIASDFRLIASTNRDLQRMADEGTFRRDLLFRLSAFPIELPPLRERKSDIAAMTLHHVKRACRRFGLEPMGCAPEFLAALGAYDWPGNARELLNVIERAVALARDTGILLRTHLPPNMLSAKMTAPRPPKETPNRDVAREASLPPLRAYRENAIAQAEQQYLRALLKQSRGDIPEACRTAGLSRSRLYALLQRHGISVKQGMLS